MEFKKVNIADVQDLQRISKVTFTETFSDLNSSENMQKYFSENLSIEKLTEEVTNPDSQFYFVVENDMVIGYFKINFKDAQTEIITKDAAEIERIYLLKEYIGKNKGRQLLEKIIDIAQQNNIIFLWLGVWEKNIRAIRFYIKNGFVEFDQHNFILGDDVQTDLLFKLQLEAYRSPS